MTVDQTDPQFPVGLTPSQDPDPAVDGTTTINVTSTVTNLDFGFAPPPASIAGVVYEDLNNNGVQDGGEGPIPGATITLTAADGSTQTAITDGSGAYLFDDLPAGTYSVTETQPAGYLDGKDTAGSEGGTRRRRERQDHRHHPRRR